MKRRAFLGYSTAAGMTVAFGGFANLSAAAERKGSTAALRSRGYGELVPMAANNTGERVLALPRGFSYNVLGVTGDKMSDGRLTPPDHDGMAAFGVNGKLRLVRNHEINDDVPKEGVTIGTENHYDDQAGGGTTTLVIDPETRLIERDFVSLRQETQEPQGVGPPAQLFSVPSSSRSGVFEETTLGGDFDRLRG